MGAVLVGAEVAEPLLNPGGVPPAQVVVQPRVELVYGFGFLDAEPFLLEVAEDPLHDCVVQTRGLGETLTGQSLPWLTCPARGCVGTD